MKNNLTQKEYDAAMEPYYQRLQWNLKHLFDSKEHNPFLDKEEHGVAEERTGFQDLFHSIKNVVKESRRLRGKSKWID